MYGAPGSDKGHAKRRRLDRFRYETDVGHRRQRLRGEYRQAVYYCQALTLAGHKDWTLPSIDDLHKLFGGPANANGFHIVAPIKLSGWTWSSSPGKEPGEEWALDFGDGGRASVVMGDSGFNRALCVRRLP